MKRYFLLSVYCTCSAYNTTRSHDPSNKPTIVCDYCKKKVSWEHWHLSLSGKKKFLYAKNKKEALKALEILQSENR
ncbi:MAG TPA: hypothetical protein VMZ91_01230 [Candidatus Paceibacterota bacterium]|nr:hypothetical protein [Candidatus Paceibacterota bacterium]